jgi:rSAM/selenodomain-associated transferase 2
VTPAVSVIIPTLNEEAWIAGSIRSASAAGAAEVLVCDGGSSDGTVAIAEREGARVIRCEQKRSRQLNLGASESRHPALLFLHADTLLPATAASAVETALNSGYLFGGFRLRFVERSAGLRLAATLINLRTSLTRCPWGDQAQFVARDQFLAGGGYADLALMEDYELALRMKGLGPTTVLHLAVTTSGRRFLEKGILRTAIMNWRIILAYHLGRSPDALAQMYRR